MPKALIQGVAGGLARRPTDIARRDPGDAGA